ncbi:MAG: hypothetical protein AB7V27_06485 [Candidatus Binatia bacterium]
MAAGAQDLIARLVKNLESSARQLREDVRQRGASAPNLQNVAEQLRQSGVDIARQVEKYVHDLRLSLEKGARTERPRTAKRASTKRGGVKAKSANAKRRRTSAGAR